MKSRWLREDAHEISAAWQRRGCLCDKRFLVTRLNLSLLRVLNGLPTTHGKIQKREGPTIQGYTIAAPPPIHSQSVSTNAQAGVDTADSLCSLQAALRASGGRRVSEVVGSVARRRGEVVGVDLRVPVASPDVEVGLSRELSRGLSREALHGPEGVGLLAAGAMSGGKGGRISISREQGTSVSRCKAWKDNYGNGTVLS